MNQTFRRSVARCGLFVLAAILGTVPGIGQQTLGSLNGTVLDPTGAAVGGAKVTATNASINVTRTTTTQGTGFYQIFNLPIGAYVVTVTHEGFESTSISGINVQEAAAATVNATLKIGQMTESVEVTANPLLNATDTTNGYTLDSSQIQLTPLATGSFTQLAVLAPGVSAELLSNLDSNAGLGNQPIWANGQRDTSNTFQLNGVDSTNIFNGKSSSGSPSQRYNFGVGETPSVGGEYGTGTSVYESNGNSLPSPPPEFLQELRVNTSMYDAQQGATSGAQIDANTGTGTNSLHGQFFGAFANNALNAAPFFFKQEYLLTAQQGVGSFPESLANPAIHRWSTGAQVGGPLMKNKLFYFLAYQHGYNSDQATGLSQFNVPSGLTDDRSNTGLENAYTSWNEGAAGTVTIDPVAAAILNAKLPDGSYMIPSDQNNGAAYAYGVPNVTLIGTSVLATDQGAASLDDDLTKNDRLGFKYYYQHDPVHKPYGLSQTGGFPLTQQNGSQVGALDNTIAIGSKLNWEQRLGYVRMYSNSYDQQTVLPDPTLGPTFGISSTNTSGVPIAPGVMPGLDMLEFATKFSTDSPALKVGPYSSESTTINTGYFQNRLNPSTNVIFLLGKHTLVAGAGYSYTQLNIENNRDGMLSAETKSFKTFLEGDVKSSTVLDSIVPGSNRNNSDRYYRSNEIDSYLQDKWQLLPNLSITAGVRYDYHGGLTEKYGNMFNFDPSLYSVTGDVTNGFTVNNAGFVVAPNNAYASKINSANVAGSDSTLTGRQWGISPRIGFAWAPKRNEGRVVFSGGAGIYYDRGELFTYLSQPFGAAGGGGVFGVTQAAPLVTLVTGAGKTLENPMGTPSYVPPSADPGQINQALQTELNNIAGPTSETSYGPACGAIANQEDYTACTPTIDFGAYGNNNVLPYTINYTLKMQWQPRNDTAIDIGYVGNRGRHSVIPIPFNEPGIATPSNPINGETSSYGWQVLNSNSFDASGYDYEPIAGEPWNTYSGGNIDYRVPYVGYNYNAALFKTVGVSAYDALETHLEKRMSHNLQGGVSYTWSRALDEQSDIGIFFTGDNPDKLRDSWGPADFDRTNILSGNFQVKVPDMAKAHSLMSYFTNGWNMTGLVVAQSGQPYSLYEFYGASGSIYVGNYPNLMNPILPIKDPSNPKSAFTGNKGDFRGGGGSYMPTINPSAIAINYLSPGEKGIPISTGSDPQDIYETDFAPSDQRNIFRQAFQKRADISFRKNFQVTEKVSLLYAFNIFNITNTTSLDVPQNQTQIAQSDGCSSYEETQQYDNCALGYLNYGEIATSNKPADQISARNNIYVLPVVNGSGKATTVPTTLTNGQGTCTTYSYASSAGCPNNGATFGSVTGVIGGSRAVTMNLHITF